MLMFGPRFVSPRTAPPPHSRATHVMAGSYEERLTRSELDLSDKVMLYSYVMLFSLYFAWSSAGHSKMLNLSKVFCQLLPHLV